MSSTETSDGQNRFNAGPPNAHIASDAKDERSLSNRAAAEVSKEVEEAAHTSKRNDPLAPAREHGNEPSQGAKKDAEILRDEEEYLKQKDAKKQS
ncbi:hypothetical protein D9613_004326 [Agrocybe pediades]|uniref:Uncharacterized protein n=1 Tax=Agrocybe pediades TaxID=84607 RepID=A0A8H4QJF8_9AGAR|nr:hypothetical protein D9613_004326 [Agrocybe pediades]KAF9561626.1 hypothetical protein CPC08DRAFT_664154 [Agrocybe pediades]